MPSFTYKAKDRKGQILTGTLEVESRAVVVTRLQSMGYFPIDIQGGESKGEGRLASLTRSKGPRIKSADMSNFYRQMSDLIGAGVPLVKALAIVKSQTPNRSLAEILSAVNSDVQGGDTFASALEKHPAQFPKLTIALIHAGETGGLLDQTLVRIADFAEAQEELKGKIKSALAYPSVMVCVGIGAVIFLLSYVMPKVLTIFAELNQTLPAMTQMLIDISAILRVYWWVIVGTLALVYFLFKRWVATDVGAMAFHRFLLRVPVLGDLILQREVANFTRTLGSLLRNGVPILTALSISSEVMTLRPIRQEIEKIPEGITQGSGMAPTLRESKIFPPVVVNMVSIGEETGHLPEVLLRVAVSYERNVDQSVKTMTSFIEPLIILALGLVVGFVVIAMLLPIFSIDPSAGM